MEQNDASMKIPRIFLKRGVVLTHRHPLNSGANNQLQGTLLSSDLDRTETMSG